MRYDDSFDKVYNDCDESRDEKPDGTRDGNQKESWQVE